MSFATYSPEDDQRPTPAPRPAPAQLSKVEQFMAARIRAMIEHGWTWGQIAEATDLTPAQVRWLATHA